MQQLFFYQVTLFVLQLTDLPKMEMLKLEFGY